MPTIDELAATVKELQERVQHLEAEREIRELLARHDYHFDCKRDDAWLSLWTDDGACDMLSTLTYPDGSVREFKKRWAGRTGLQEFISNPEGHHLPGFYGHSMHVASLNLVIHVQGNTAIANSYSCLFQEQQGDVTLLSSGNNQWMLKKIDGRWWLHERRRRQTGTVAFVENLDATPT